MLVAKKLISDQLSPAYGKEEIAGITRLIFEKVTGLSRLQVHLNQNETISAANLAQIREILNRLNRFEPIQYILGETEFYGLIMRVTPAVLIPRPETEELVDWIIRDYQKQTPCILDIGTGSGCIPVSLISHMPGATAEGWEISSEALAVAKGNAVLNNVEVEFCLTDILNSDFPAVNKRYDLIVSNPPYVTTSEMPLMHRNVTEYEPHVALFVPDTDPLIFYRTITDLAITLLKPEGKIYFEINERFGKETVQLLSEKGFLNVTLRNDINGKVRMIRGERPSNV
jgi:release factor glutamine methyltransferase